MEYDLPDISFIIKLLLVAFINKSTYIPGSMWSNWQNVAVQPPQTAQPPQTHTHAKIWQQWERLVLKFQEDV